MTIYIIPCGAKKRQYQCRADKMYLGPYHKLCLTYARKNAVDDQHIRILSAKYGLLPLDQVIDPYELRMGKANCVTRKTVKEQATEQGILESSVICLGGVLYIRIIKFVWPEASCPIPKGLGIGQQMQWLKRNT